MDMQARQNFCSHRNTRKVLDTPDCIWRTEKCISSCHVSLVNPAESCGRLPVPTVSKCCYPGLLQSVSLSIVQEHVTLRAFVICKYDISFAYLPSYVGILEYIVKVLLQTDFRVWLSSLVFGIKVKGGVIYETYIEHIMDHCYCLLQCRIPDFCFSQVR